MDFKDSNRPIECGQIGPSILPIDCLLLIQWGKDGWLSALREQPSAPRRNLSGAICIPALGGGFPKEGDQLSQFTQDFTGFATESATSQEIPQSRTDWSWWVRSPCSQASALLKGSTKRGYSTAKMNRASYFISLIKSKSPELKNQHLVT